MAHGTPAVGRTEVDAAGNSDEHLIRRAQDGDTAAFAELVRRYQDRIHNLAYRMLSRREEAEDVAQETFLHVYRSMASFRGERFSSWVYKIASNLCLDYLRKHRARLLSLDAPAEAESDLHREIPDSGHLPEDLVTQAELAGDVQRAIATLPPKYRLVVVLRHFYDLSYEEIVQVSNLPLGTVKTRLFRARDLLRKRLGTIATEGGWGA
ncbi:MAG: sigma-70 family RNA polymerase sigma factor [bacterium]|nr:sigma-70 family RNA polymerase sigma factor [bacterium]